MKSGLLKFFGGFLIFACILYLLQIDRKSDLLPTIKPNACIIVLLRNEDLNRFINTIQNFEKNLNDKFNYPYILFNNDDFSEQFKNEIVKYTKSKIEFAKIPVEHWSIPNWIDGQKLNHSLKTIRFPVNYRHMCRFYSGFFFRQISTLKYDFYMRIDLDSNFLCPVENDPFKIFQSNKNLQFGFTVTSEEARWTIPTLWKSISEWSNKNTLSEKMPKKESMTSYVSNDDGKSLTSMCMFYNNFEIARFSLFRDPSYISFFEHLDKAGGFFYERWGDSPIHTYYVALRLRKSQVHMFLDIGYEHQGTRNFEMKHSKCVKRVSGCSKFFLP